MKKNFFTAFRILFGVVLMLWVGMGIFGWQPPPVAGGAENLRDAIFESGYIIPSVLIVYFVVGAAYLLNRYVALTSVLLFPVSLNILMFHLFMNPNPRSLSIASALFIANIVMLVRHRRAYLPVLSAE